MQFEDFISQLYITTTWTCRDLFPLDLGPVVQRAKDVQPSKKSLMNDKSAFDKLRILPSQRQWHKI